MIEKDIVIRLAEEQLAFSDCYLVDVTINPDNLIVVEIDHDEAVGIDNCVALSQYIEERIDRNIEDYALEVGSSGIGSPLRIFRQYIKNIGNEMELLLKTGMKLKGTLIAADELGITVENRGNQERRRKEGKERTLKQSYDPTFLQSNGLSKPEIQTYTYSEIKYIKNIIRFN